MNSRHGGCGYEYSTCAYTADNTEIRQAVTSHTSLFMYLHSCSSLVVAQSASELITCAVRI